MTGWICCPGNPERLSAVLPIAHPRARDAKVSLAALADDPVLEYADATETWSAVRNADPRPDGTRPTSRTSRSPTYRRGRRVAHPAHDPQPPARGRVPLRLPPHDLRDTLAFPAAHGILPEVTAVTLDQAPAVLDAMANGSAHGRSVLTFARPAGPPPDT